MKLALKSTRSSQKQFEMISLRWSVILLQVMEGQSCTGEEHMSKEKEFTKTQQIISQMT